MFVVNQKLRFGLLLIGVVVLLTGCFGLFSSQPPKITDPPTLLQGTLSGPSGLLDNSETTAAMGSPNSVNFLHNFTTWLSGQSAVAATATISGEVALVNVPVAIYNLQDFLQAPDHAQALQHTTTDEDGNYSLTGLPAGVDLIVVAATVPRLSAIVPAAGSNMTADVNSATALVAEAWAQTLQDESQSVSAADLASAVAEAKQLLDNLQLDPAALLDALEDLIPQNFGEGLPDTPPPAFEGLVASIKSSAPSSQDEPGDGNGDDNGNGDGGEPPADPIEISIAADLDTIYVGETVSLTASVQGADDATITWTSSLGGTFEPQEGTQVTWAPDSEGEATITAEATATGHDGPAFATIQITVLENQSVLCGTGNGTEENPRIICTVEQLQDIKLNVAGYYVLGDHIVAEDTSSWNQGAGFEPISSFSGTLDGQDFTIIGLYIDRPTETNVGLFASITATGEVRDLGLVEGYVRGKEKVGAIAGRNLGTIRDSYNAGEVQGVDGFGNIGGLVGENFAGTSVRPAEGLIINSFNSGKVGTAGFVHTVGGITGYNHSRGKIQNSYNIGEVGSAESGGSIGGIVGLMVREERSGTLVDGSYNDGVVIGGGESVGGVVGKTQYGVTVRDSYNLGTVEGLSNYVGGVVGTNNNGSKIEHSYNTGVVEGAINYVGGIAGINAYGYASEPSVVIESWNEGSVEGRDYVGGVAGLNSDSAEVINSFSNYSAQVTGHDSVGGVVGRNSSRVEGSYNTGTVQGRRYIGGVVGDNQGSVRTSFNTGGVHGDWTSIGGVAGRHDYGSPNWTSITYIEDSYNTGPVTGHGNSDQDDKSYHVGGVVGYHAARITNTYNKGSVSGDENIGGLVGERITTSGRGVIESSYFSAGPDNAHGSFVPGSALMQESTFQGWDFVSVWTTHGDTEYADLIGNPRP